VLSQRVNALADIEAGARIEGLEADLSVLGTVVRQVAEAVADIEEDRRRNPGAPAPAAPAPATPPAEPAPAFAPEMLRRALDANRLALYIQPIVLLPSRKPQGYDLVPRLPLEEGGFAEADEFLPRSGHDELVRRLEQVLLEEAVIIARRARTAGQPTMLHLVLSRASFGDPASLERIAAVLDANQAIADALVFDIPFSQWQSLTPARRVPLGALSRKGVGFSLGAATTLRLDYSELAGLGFRMVRVDAARFIEEPRSLSDFEAGDIAAFSRRYGIELCATGVRSEQQLLSLYEDGITLAQGGHIAAPGPVRPDLTVERPARPPVPRRAEA
jgi:cyclic-di-GMP phosphodiesterase TipF (flagellum assembly factor)